MLNITVYEYTEYVFLFAEHVVRASSDYYAAALCSVCLNNLGLNYVIIGGKIVCEDGVYNGIRAAKVYSK